MAQKQSTLMEQISSAWKWLTWVVGIATALFMIVLLSQAWWWVRSAADIHPILGVVVGILILSLVGLLIGVPIMKYFKTPRVIDLPDLSDTGVTPTDLRKTVTYLDRVLTHAASNPNLSETHSRIPSARTELQALAQRVKSCSDDDASKLNEELSQWAKKTLTPIWEPVEQRVERMIYEEALKVGVATAVSPNGTLDAYLMLWRSANLIGEIAALHYGRPGLLGTARIGRDVAIAVAVAGTIQSVTDSLGNLAMHSIGGAAGFLAGPLTEGATNALVLTRIGYLAQARCRAYREWNQETQTQALMGALSATKKIALGLTAEIARKAGVGLGAVAGAVGSGVAAAAETAADHVAAAAQAAFQTANQWGSSLKSRIFGAPAKPGQ